MEIIATASIIAGILSLLCLLALHVVSPEFKPNWRMVSEYAMGKNKWLLTLFFCLWSLSTLLGAYLLMQVVITNAAIIGVLLIAVSGIGALMGGMFDIKHKLHGLSFMLGVPTLPIGALIISYHLIGQEPWNANATLILCSAHALWISVVLMALTMMLLFAGFKKAGIAMGPNAEPPKEVPQGVIAVSGYANRLLVFAYVFWVLVIAQTYLSI